MDSGEAGPRYREPALLFLNQRDGTFRNISKLVGPALQLQRVSRGVAIGDLFNDGRTEIVIENLQGAPTILQPQGGPPNHWISLELTGVKSGAGSDSGFIGNVGKTHVAVVAVECRIFIAEMGDHD